MNIFFTCILVGISLSMDAFSLALIYGTCGFSFKRQIALSFIVGIFHFFMPIMGLLFGSFIMNYFIFKVNLAVGIIFSIIGVEMLLSFKKEEEVKVLDSFLGYLFFGFTVSIDSLTTGIGLSAITHYYIFAACIFMIFSGCFTFLGFRLGNQLHQNFGKYACFVGGGMMLLLGIYYVFGH